MKRLVFRFAAFIFGAIVGASIASIFVPVSSIWSSITAILVGAIGVYIYIRKFEPLELK